MRRDKKEPENTPDESAAEEAQALAAPQELAAPQAVETERAQKMLHQQTVAETPARPAGASFGRRLWRAFVFLFKLGLFLVILAGIWAAVYFGWPVVYKQYILPVQNNTAQMALLEGTQQASQQQLFALQTQLPALSTEQARQSTAQLQQAAALTALAPRMDTLASGITEHTQALATLEAVQIILENADQVRRAELESQVATLKSMELLSRARLFLYQSNFGLAKLDVQAARDLLAGLPASDGRLLEVVQRLDLTLSRLPDFPVAASDDLDIAWQVLLQGYPSPGPTFVATPTAVLLVGSETPMPTSSPTFAPTATAYSSPTLVPTSTP